MITHLTTSPKSTHLTIIRDPIHNYIPISQLERALIDHRLFQRLRYVSQNGLAHLVFPSNRTSRFIHSLGVMHLAGEFILHGTANATQVDALHFWEAVKALVHETLDTLIRDRQEILDYLRTTDDPLYREWGFDTLSSDDAPKIVLLQSIRLAAVMHDLGHFPFSHTLEHVFDDARRALSSKLTSKNKEFVEILSSLVEGYGDQPDTTKLHEVIGKALMKHIFSRSREHQLFGLLCFHIACKIAEYREGLKSYGVLKCLHSIVSGELDADRCDYVRRDAYESGLFGDYDIHRILSTVRFKRPLNGELELNPTTVASSALEGFFLERYRVFVWLVFHPMVLRLEVALARSSMILLEIFLGEVTYEHEAKPVLEVLRKYAFDRLWTVFRERDTYDAYVACDENWLLTIFRETQSVLAGISKPLPLELCALKAYLDLICDRHKMYIQPLWKRQEEYREFATKLAAIVGGRTDFPSVLQRMKDEDEVVWCNRLIETVLDGRVKKKGRITTMRELEKEIQTGLEKREWTGGIIAHWLEFSPYKTINVLDAKLGDVLRPLENVSTIVRELPRMWTHEIRFRPFWLARKREGGGVKLMQIQGPELVDFTEAFVEVLISWGAPSDMSAE